MTKVRRPLWLALGAVIAGAALGVQCRDEQVNGLDRAMAACDRFIECTLAVAPANVGPFLEAYGPDGSCWEGANGEKVELCRSACVRSREELLEAYPDEAACGECSSASDCSGGLPACDLDRHECVQCDSYQHCGGDLPACDVILHVCVQCARHGDCRDGARPYCDGTLCVECLTDAECGEGQACGAGSRCVDKPVVCEPGERRCTKNDLEVCDVNGVGWELVTRCAAEGRVCDAKALECVVELVCDPGKDFCAFDAENARAEVRTCSADGTGSTFKTNCVDEGRTCNAGACVVTEYGPCNVPRDEPCAKSGDVCMQVGHGMGGLEDDPYHYVCSSACPGQSACPEPLPMGSEGFNHCNTGRCYLGCDAETGKDCPPGMFCSWGWEGTYCAWATY